MPQARESPSGWNRTIASDIRSISARIHWQRDESTGKVLPLLPLRYQHSASLFGFRWIEEDGGIEPLRHRCRTTVFKTACRPFSGIFQLRVSDKIDILHNSTQIFTQLIVDAISLALSLKSFPIYFDHCHLYRIPSSNR